MDARQFLMGSGQPGFSFRRPGDRVVGQITGEPTVQQQRNYADGQPAVWEKSGDPKLQLLVPVQTQYRNYEGVSRPDLSRPDTGGRILYVKGKHFESALKAAILGAGASWLEVGGWVDITYTEDDYNSPAGIKPKMFAVTYRPPTPQERAQFGAQQHQVPPTRQPQQPQQFGGPGQQQPGWQQPGWGQPAAGGPPQTTRTVAYNGHEPNGWRDPYPPTQPAHHEVGPPPEWATPTSGVPTSPGAPVTPTSGPPVMSTLQRIEAARNAGAEEPPY